MFSHFCHHHTNPGITNADNTRGPQLYAGHHTILTCITFHAPKFPILRICASLNLYVLVPSVLEQPLPNYIYPFQLFTERQVELG